ncbi:unnamed protein product [Cylicocyclus nassatus]|uniref:Uncharacterized protein n=1 Tax=Cylicocyclus nassatus TaxID=53992 RepID=A0AA36GNR1_CYLNA|nr:unnamed protein product [Cylicocyclus nassatus]
MHDDLLDKIDLNCKEIVEGNDEVIKEARSWTYDTKKIEEDIRFAENKCVAIKELFGFDKKNTTIEELQYPIAYGAIVYQNFVQVMFMLSAFYRSHNDYCIAVSGSANRTFKYLMNQFGKCFDNVQILERPPIGWASFEIINTVWACVEILSKSKTKWMYYQQLSGVDVPLKTNFEMVEIFKRLNETVNIDFEKHPKYLLKGKKMKESPLPLIRSSMSGAIPRKTIDRIVEAGKAPTLLSFLNGTQVPDESFWATITGNTKKFPVPGGTDGNEWINFTAGYNLTHRSYVARYESAGPHEALMNYYIARYQVWGKKWCRGMMFRYSCIFGIDDLAVVLSQPHLIAHKFYLEFEPAAYFCVLKELRAREARPLSLNLNSYAELPQVELSAGVPYEKLKHRVWMINKYWKR